MKATGIVRRIDDLGRVVIPKEIRRTLRIREGDPLEIFTDREGMDGHTSNVIKIGENSLEITKKGLMNTRLVVEKGKSHRTVYQTPFGDIELSLTGQELTVTETEERIDIRAEYVLAVNEENLSECTIEMNIRPREAGNLNLQG